MWFLITKRDWLWSVGWTSECLLPFNATNPKCLGRLPLNINVGLFPVANLVLHKSTRNALAWLSWLVWHVLFRSWNVTTPDRTCNKRQGRDNHLWSNPGEETISRTEPWGAPRRQSSCSTPRLVYYRKVQTSKRVQISKSALRGQLPQHSYVCHGVLKFG